MGIFEDFANSLDKNTGEFSFMGSPSIGSPSSVPTQVDELQDQRPSVFTQFADQLGGKGEFSFMDQPRGPVLPERVDRGFTMDIATGLVAGVADLAEQYARAIRLGNIKPASEMSWVDNMASWIIDNKADLEEKYPYVFQDTKSDSEVRDRVSQALHGGARGAVQSLGTMLPGAIAGTYAGPVGTIVGAATGGGVVFGLAEYDKFADDIYTYNRKNPDKAIPEEKWKPYAVASAIQEGGLEFASDIIEAATFKLGKLATAPFKESVQSILKLGWRGGAKDFLKKIAITEMAEIPTEFQQNWFENYLRSKAGLPQDQTPLESAIDSIGPTIVATLLTGGVFHAHNARTRGKIVDALTDNTADPITRVNAATAVYNELKEVDKQMKTNLAEKWDGIASYYIGNAEAIPIDRNLLEMKDKAGLTQEKLVKQQLDADIKLFEDRGFTKEEAEKKAIEFDNQQIAAEQEERKLHDENRPAAQRLFFVELFNTLKQGFVDKGFSPERSDDLAKMVMGSREEVKQESTVMQPSIILGSDGIPMLKPLPQDSTSETQKQVDVQDTIVKLPAVLKTSAIQNPVGNPFGSKGAATLYLKSKGLGETHQAFQLGENSWIGLPRPLVSTVNTLLQATRTKPMIESPGEIRAKEVAPNVQQAFRGVARPGDIFASSGQPFTSKGVVNMVLKRMATKLPGITERYVPFPIAKAKDGKTDLWVARKVDTLDQDQRDVYASHLEKEKPTTTTIPPPTMTTTTGEPQVKTWVKEQEQKPIQPGEITVAAPVVPPVQEETKEQRVNLVLRENIDNLTPEQKDRVIKDLRGQVLLHPLTQLRNRFAYLMDPRLKFQATIDLDSLKWINDNMGHETGDKYIKLLGDTLRNIPGIAYHISGDEFVVQHNSKTVLSLGLKAAQKALKNVTVTAKAADGKIYTKKGVDFSYGLGRTMEEAENALQERKRLRTVKGLRAERGGQPANVVEVTPSPLAGNVVPPPSGGVSKVEGTEVQPKIEKPIKNELTKLKEKVIRATAHGLTQQLETGVAVDPKLVAKFPSIAKVWHQDETGKWIKTELAYKTKLSDLEKENRKEARTVTKAIEKAKEKEKNAPKPKIEQHPGFLSREKYEVNAEQFLINAPGKGFVPKTARSPFDIIQSIRAMFNAKLHGQDVSLERAANFLNQVATALDVGDLDTHFESSEDKVMFQNTVDMVVDFADKVIKLTEAGRFAKAKVKSGALSIDAVVRAISPVIRLWGIGNNIDVHVVDNYDDESIPLALRAAIAENQVPVAAAYQAYEEDKPDIFLFSGQITNPRDAIGYLLHEAIGHHGFQAAFGLNSVPILRRIWNSYNGSELMTAIIERYPEFNPANFVDQNRLAEEFLAHNAELLSNKDRSLWTRIKDFVDRKLREWGLKETTDDKFLRDILMKSARAVRSENMRQEVRFTVAQFVKTGISAEPRFAKVKTELSNLTTQPATTESTDIPPNPNMGPVELNKLRDLLKQEGTIMLRTLAAQRPSRLPKLTAMEKILRSPEWYNHPIMKKIVDYAIERHDRYYELFNNFNTIPGQDTIVIDKTVALKHKGLSLPQRLMGESSPEYKLLSKVITQLDTGVWREGIPEDSKITYLEYLKQQNVPQDVINVFQLHRAAYDRVLDELIKTTKQIVDAIELDAKERGVKTQYPSLPTLNDKGEVTSVTLREVLDHMNSLRGTYAPRLREKGEWEILADKKGHERLRIHKSLRLDAERVKYKLEQEGWSVVLNERERMSEDVYASLRIVNTAHAIEVAMNRAKKGLDPELAKKFNEQLLQNVADLIRMRGFRSLMIKRRLDTHVGGYIEDPNERFIAYMTNVSAGIAKGEAAQKMFRALTGYTTGTGAERVKTPGIDPAKERRAYDTATQYIIEQLRNMDAADRVVGYIKSVATLKYLGFNPHAPVVNIVSLATTAPTAIHQYVLGGKGSLIKIGEAITRASKDYVSVMKGRKLENTDEQEFMDEIKSRGYDDPAYTRDAQGTVQRLHGKLWTTIMKNAMYVFGKSEQWIRGTTMLAAFRLAKENGATNVVANQLAHEASNKAHGIYGKATLPAWAQGKGAAAKLFQVLYTYQKFPHNYLQMLYDVGVSKRNIKGLTFGLLSPIFLGGAAVWPFKDLFLGMISGLLKLLGIRIDPEKWFWDTFRKNFGKTSERIARYGAFGALNVDLSGSLSIGVGIPKKIPEMFGVAGGLASDISSAAEYAQMGHYGRVAEKVLPNAFGNLFRAWREINEGVTTSTGKRVWDSSGKPYMPKTTATLMRAAGFRTAEQAMIQERAWETRREIQSFKDQRDKILQQYRFYVENPRHSPGDLKAVLDKIKRYNDAVLLYDKSGVIPVIKQQTLKSVAKSVFVPEKGLRIDLERNN